jgi:serine/threonine-protein kinase
MGEVYRATDTRLGRDVALKLLPEEFAADPERLARFEREAKLLAALNHPGIAHLYGFDAVSVGDGAKAHVLVMELVEGEDLAARLKRGALPVDEAVAIAKQVAEALEEAHEKGIVHRDLKPANVKLAPDGKVKVLDFGLAKAWTGEAPGGASSADLSQSPTLAHTGTAAGLILGTAAYMAPEQARGRAVDKRADVWAFGVLLFEMLTGRRLFEGATVSDTLAAVLKTDPDWSLLPKDTPPGVRRILRRCLDRDPKSRLRDIGEARVGLDARAADEPVILASPEGRPRGVAAWVAVLGALLAALAGGVAGRLAPRAESTLPQPTALFALETDRPLLSNSWHGFSGLAVSRDGQRIAYVAPDGAHERIFLRRLDSLDARALHGTEGASNPFFSPDGAWLGFFAGRMLKKISVDGGAPVTLAPARDNRGGTWTDGGEIVFSRDPGSGLLRVPAEGGSARPLTELDAARGDMSHRWPSYIAGSDAVLLTLKPKALQTFDDAQIAVVSLRGGAPKHVLDGGTAASYSSTGHIVYAHDGALLAAPFDSARLVTSGAPFVALPAVSRSSATGSAHYALSQSGTLVTLPGSVDVDNRTLVRVDPSGHAEPLTREVRPFGTVRTSPDGKRLALWLGYSNDEIWTFEIARGILTRIAQGAYNPVWSPDGQWIVFTGTAADADITRVRADGGGEPEVLAARKRTEGDQLGTSISPDGKVLAYTYDTPETGSDVWTLSLDTGEKKPLLATRFNEQAAVFSPDGRLIAFVSDESGQSEVYVQAFPDAGSKRQVSVGGGWAPVWSRKPGEFFYQKGATLMQVSMRGASAEPESPHELMGGLLLMPTTLGDMVAPWDVAPDGRGFVMPRQLDQKQASVLMVALHWSPAAGKTETPRDPAR